MADSMRVGQVMSINMLPDDVLLSIYDFCADEYQVTKEEIEAWQSLVHVCRRWRNLVFGSPRRLKLRLFCSEKTPARDTLDVWPPLPLAIQRSLSEGLDDIIAVLEHRDRVNSIYFWQPEWQADGSVLEKVLAAMLEPFPKLKLLRLLSPIKPMPVLPDSFLGRSTPRLRFLELDGIPFPGLPKLLLSATNLVALHLSNIPHSGYLSPEAVVTSLSSLTSLELLRLKFQSSRYHPDLAIRRLFPPTRSVLPALTIFSFKGVCEYLDDFVARIDAPRVDDLSITFFNDIVFDAPQFTKFINRTPTLKAPENASVIFEDRAASVSFSQTSGSGSFKVRISCRDLDWQISSLEQVCTSCLPPLSSTEDLYIYPDPYSRPHWQNNNPFSRPHWQDNIENSLWLELLHPFTAVKNLYLSEESAPFIAPALQELVEGRPTEVLPTLQNIFLEGLQSSGPVHEGIGKFVAARQLSSHPITVSLWESSVTEVDD